MEGEFGAVGNQDARRAVAAKIASCPAYGLGNQPSTVASLVGRSHWTARSVAGMREKSFSTLACSARVHGVEQTVLLSPTERLSTPKQAGSG
jgi:hypothetical protein